MTQTVERRVSVPLTNPVPGAWLQPADGSIPPVYVPFEAQYRKNERTRKDEIVGHAPGAHIKRLLGEGAMYASGPDGIAPAQSVGDASVEADLRAQLEQMKQSQDQLMEELASLRTKMAGDPNVPNAPKRAR